MTAQQGAGRGALRLARAELARIEKQIGTGSARNANGRWSAAQARSLNRLRYLEATYRARICLLERTAA